MKTNYRPRLWIFHSSGEIFPITTASASILVAHRIEVSKSGSAWIETQRTFLLPQTFLVAQGHFYAAFCHQESPLFSHYYRALKIFVNYSQSALKFLQDLGLVTEFHSKL